MSGVAPKDIFIAPITAVKMTCEKAKLALSDIDLIELNESFAAQMLACGKGLNLDEAKVNVHGGRLCRSAGPTPSVRAAMAACWSR